MNKLTIKHAIAAGAMFLTVALGTAPALAGSPGAVQSAGTFPVRSTTVRYIRVLVTLNIRSGPGYGYPVIEHLYAGNQMPVTGLSMDGRWWRVLCPPHGSIGNCFVARNSYWSVPALPYSPNEPFPIMNTSARQVKALVNINLRRGPDTGYVRLGSLPRGNTTNVYGVSVDGNWYQVDCPTGSTSVYCFMSNSALYSRRVD